MGKVFDILFPGGDSGHSEILMGSKLDQDPSSIFNEDPPNSISVILQTNELTDKQTVMN